MAEPWRRSPSELTRSGYEEDWPVRSSSDHERSLSLPWLTGREDGARRNGPPNRVWFRYHINSTPNTIMSRKMIINDWEICSDLCVYAVQTFLYVLACIHLCLFNKAIGRMSYIVRLLLLLLLCSCPIFDAQTLVSQKAERRSLSKHIRGLV